MPPFGCFDSELSIRIIFFRTVKIAQVRMPAKFIHTIKRTRLPEIPANLNGAASKTSVRHNPVAGTPSPDYNLKR